MLYSSIVNATHGVNDCLKTPEPLESKQRLFESFIDTDVIDCLVSSDDLISPGTELGNTGIDCWRGCAAHTAAPGDNTNQGPSSILFTHQRTTGVTLKHTHAHTQRQVCYLSELSNM